MSILCQYRYTLYVLLLINQIILNHVRGVVASADIAVYDNRSSLESDGQFGQYALTPSVSQLTQESESGQAINRVRS